jgi:hypothetical protein
MSAVIPLWLKALRSVAAGDPDPFRVSFHGVGSQDRAPIEVIADVDRRVRIPRSPQVFLFSLDVATLAPKRK